jgi:hypothetical protein
MFEINILNIITFLYIIFIFLIIKECYNIYKLEKQNKKLLFKKKLLVKKYIK